MLQRIMGRTPLLRIEREAAIQQIREQSQFLCLRVC